MCVFAWLMCETVHAVKLALIISQEVALNNIHWFNTHIFPPSHTNQTSDTEVFSLTATSHPSAPKRADSVWAHPWTRWRRRKSRSQHMVRAMATLRLSMKSAGADSGKMCSPQWIGIAACYHFLLTFSLHRMLDKQTTTITTTNNNKQTNDNNNKQTNDNNNKQQMTTTTTTTTIFNHKQQQTTTNNKQQTTNNKQQQQQQQLQTTTTNHNKELFFWCARKTRRPCTP